MAQTSSIQYKFDPTVHEWAEKGKEEALSPLLPICDPHHHLWEPEKAFPAIAPLPAPFANLFGERLGLGPYSYDDFHKDIADNNVTETVFVECGAFYDRKEMVPEDPVKEVVGIAKIAVEEAQPAGRPMYIVGHVDFCQGAEVVRAVLKKAVEEGKGLLKSIRYYLADSDDPEISWEKRGKELSKGEKFREGFAVLQELGLCYDTWCFHVNLPEIIDLAKSFPEQRIIFEHVGFPLGVGSYRREGAAAPGGEGGPNDDTIVQWKKDMSELASYSNVVLKLSGLTMPVCGFGWEKRETPPHSTELARAMAPFYLFCINTFGVDRCMFASNFPVDKASCNYTALWNAFKRIIRIANGEEDIDLSTSSPLLQPLPSLKFSEEDVGKLFRDNALKYYNVVV